MKLSFFGAAKQVTGSMYLLTLDSGYKILIDCGMDYEMKKNPVARAQLFPFEPVTVDLVILTHAHIDHSGNLPALVGAGFKGHIICTPATAELTQFLLFDSANIQWSNYRKTLANTKKTKRDYIEKPLFNEKQVKDCIDQFLTLNLNKDFRINPEISLKLVEAGHLLGAASVALTITEKGVTQTIGFTGDLGRANSKLVRNGEILEGVSYLITEATYGGRKHMVEKSAEDELLNYIQKTCIEFRGRLVIPAFSVGRTQAIVFTIRQLKQKGLIPSWLKVFVDSPLAIKSTPVYERHAYLLNEEAHSFMRENGSLFQFEGIEYLEDMDQHEELMHYYDPCIIISAAGMVEGGRIQEHVMNNIENPYSTILIAGYCAEGTLGHRLLLGQSTIKIKNKDKNVYAQIARTDVYSSHPDHDEVKNYILNTRDNSQGNFRKVFLVHGDIPHLEAMRVSLEESGLSGKVVVPDMLEEFYL
ncbi:MAG: MBL fold metallo-hydrolase [Bacteroidetes bacterium]|jgi:metallo-beta-lactamase family protein|nr:MBL fold metallo-hydrolase [Bacteroidota bacterium]